MSGRIEKPKIDLKKLEDLKKAKEKATDPAFKDSIQQKITGLKEAFTK